MPRVQESAFGCFVKLTAEGNPPFPLIRAVVENSQAGHVFAESESQPSAALVITRFGFTRWIGDESQLGLDSIVEELLRHGSENVPSYWLWYAPPARWQQRLEEALGPVRHRERCRFLFNNGRPKDTNEHIEPFDLRLVDAGLLPEIEPLGIALESRFWSSASDFLTKGFGVCGLDGSRIVSLCYTACVAGGLAEIDIVTLPEYRGRGLARIVADRFIQECLDRGLQPTWDCFTENAPSMRLAEGLGFTAARRYSLYSFNTPLALAPTADILGGGE